MQYTEIELLEAKRQIESTLHKTREVKKTFMNKENADKYKSQITLAKRRIIAFEISLSLIEAELLKLAENKETHQGVRR